MGKRRTRLEKLTELLDTRERIVTYYSENKKNMYWRTRNKMEDEIKRIEFYIQQLVNTSLAMAHTVYPEKQIEIESKMNYE